MMYETFSSQIALVSYAFIENAFKFASIPINEGLYCLCYLYPDAEMTHGSFFLNLNVLHYSALSYLRGIPSSSSINGSFKSSSEVKLFDEVNDAEYVDIILILHKTKDAIQWKCDDNSIKLIRAILYLYVIVDSSVIILPKDRIFLTDVAYICVNTNLNGRAVARVSTTTKVRINDVITFRKFKNNFIEKHEHIVGLSNQKHLLECIYNANSIVKLSSGAFGKCIQKVLVIGPTGCGKSSLIRSFSESKKCGLINVDVSKFLYLSPGTSEKLLSSIFNEAFKYCETDICIIHFEKFESVWQHSKSTAQLKRLSGQLMQILGNLDRYRGVIVIASTNDVHYLDSWLRTSSNFQVEINVGLPDEEERKEILKLYNPVYQDDIFKEVASFTAGFSGTDIRFLSRKFGSVINTVDKFFLKKSDLIQIWMQCIRKHRPSTIRKGLGTIQLCNAQLDYLGGLKDVKKLLKSYIELPLKKPDAYRRLGISMLKGILLYGPPGCAKTSIACAISNESNINFLSVSAAELYSSHVGEAERNVIDLFQKARLISPCILFIDELDALLGNRNTSSKNVQSKVLSTFLVEMDGIGSTYDNVSTIKKSEIVRKERNVIVIAATNRPCKIDSALLRPGRFDKHVYMGPPNTEDRLDILRKTVDQYKMPLSSDVDLLDIAEKTEFFSGADLKNLLKEAAYTALLKGKMTTEKINHDHIIQSLGFVQPSLRNVTKSDFKF